MKKTIILTIILFSLLTQSLNAQNISTPKWIEGSWYNISESLNSKLVFLTFRNDSIFISKGFSGIDNKNQESLNQKYYDYKITKFSNDNIFRIRFEKANDIIEYEFKLQNVNYSDEPVLTYSLLVNDKLKRRHSTSSNSVFERLKK
ncbi:MAG: hypothetical protein GXO49_02095 [Chlorobi bacterium]|nr:hypothetical protein [Chlorobiota bacterium]